MIPKKVRLPRAGFHAHGYRNIGTPFFSLKVKNNEAGVNRIGIVVGKSVDKRAVRRNFWERQAKAQLLKMPNLGKDIIMIIFPKTNKLTKQEFIDEMKNISKKL